MSSATLDADDGSPRRARGIPPAMLRTLDYLCISLFVTAPLWSPGYLLVGDAVFGPRIPFVYTPTSSMTMLEALLSVINLVVPSEVIEKLLFTAALVLAGLGVHRLVRVQNQAVRFAAGNLAIFNPFVYDRLMYGQWTVLLAYALLPWLWSSIGARDAQGSTSSPVWPTAAWCTAIIGVSLPMGYIACALLVMALSTQLALAAAADRRACGLRGARMLVAILVLNCSWLLPTVWLRSPDLARALGFSIEEFYAFATQADPRWGVWLTVWGGHGFWAESTGRFILLREQEAYWPLLPIALLALGVLGLAGRWAFAADRPAILTVLGCWVLSGALAAGMATPPTSALTGFLARHVFAYGGLRDTQKWGSLTLMGEIFAAAWGLDASLRRFRGPLLRRLVETGAVVAPLLFAPTMLWGCAGQLRASRYPPSWYAATRLLSRDGLAHPTLFLPYHQYLRLPFTSGVVANPAVPFFGPSITSGDNMQMPGIYADVPSGWGANTIALLQMAEAHSRSVAQILAKGGIRYILLAHAADWERYRYLQAAPGLRVVASWPDLTLIADTLPSGTTPRR